MLYELTCLISPDLDEKTLQELTSKLKELTSQAEQTNEFKKIKLAYPIAKKSEAFLAALNFKKEPQEIGAVKETLAKTDGILRFVLIKKQEPSPVPLKARVKFKGTKAEEKPLKREPGRVEPVKPRTPQEKKEALEKIEKELDELL